MGLIVLILVFVHKDVYLIREFAGAFAVIFEDISSYHRRELIGLAVYMEDKHIHNPIDSITVIRFVIRRQ